ncbi:MAG: hypothetical protein WCB68_14285 [Pyrinomonadaceae bacterium]
MNQAVMYFQRALEAAHPDEIISNLDACLVSDPVPDLAMFAYMNLANAIWERFSFNKRNGRTISDEEFWWAQRASECLRRVVGIYEHLPEHDRLEPEVNECYQDSKKFLQVATSYGLYYYRFGEMKVRDLKQPAILPMLRCLDASIE